MDNGFFTFQAKNLPEKASPALNYGDATPFLILFFGFMK